MVRLQFPVHNGSIELLRVKHPWWIPFMPQCLKITPE